MTKKDDLKVKIVSEDEALWIKVRDEAKVLIKQSEQNVKIQKAMLNLAVKKIAKEQRKAKS